MLRASALLREHPHMGRGFAHYLEERPGLIARWWRRFRQRSVPGKLGALLGYSVTGVLSYATLCTIAHVAHESAIEVAFHQPRAGIFAESTGGAGGRVDYYTIAPRSDPDGPAPGPLKGVREPFREVYQKDYTLATWEEVEATLREGDVVLMMGEGLLSWAIVTIQYAYAFMRPPALLYSHVAVVVKPAVYRYEDEVAGEDAGAAPGEAVGPQESRGWRQWLWPKARTGAAADAEVAEVLAAESRRLRQRRVKVRGAVVLEGMDNTEYDVADVHGNVLHFAVQQVEVEKRLTSTRLDPRTGKRVQAYRHCAVRRLSAVERDSASSGFASRMAAFVERNEGRPVEQNLFFPLAFFSPRFYLRVSADREREGIVCCGELAAEMYEELGMFQRHWRWVRLTDGEGKALPPDADTQRSLFERCRIAFSMLIGPHPEWDQASWATRQAADVEVCQQLAVAGLPQPTPDDLHPTNATAVPPLHVYERLHSRRELEAALPLSTRERPMTGDFPCIENWGVLADASLMMGSVQGCESLSPEERSALLRYINAHRASDESDGEGVGRDGGGKGQEVQLLPPSQSQSHASNSVNNTKPSPRALGEPLQAGMLARTVDGGTAQLQYYYKHNTMQTMPYTWTEKESERVLDWSTGAPRQRFAFARMDSTEEGRWRLRRAARAAEQGAAVPHPPPRPDDVVLVDLLHDVEGGGLGSVAAGRGPRLGPEVRMQPPHSIYFSSSSGEGEDVRTG